MGITRGKDVKDMDWEKIAGIVLEEEVIEEPEPIKIDTALKRIRKPSKKLVLKSSAANNKKCKFLVYYGNIIILKLYNL